MTVGSLGPDVISMKRTQIIVSAIIILSVLLATAGVAGAARTNSSVRLGTLDSSLLVQINTLRKAHRLSPLTLSRQLTVAADQHTTEMAAAGYFAHDSLDHTNFSDRIERSYPSAGHRSWSVGENLLFVAPDLTAAEAITLWMNSPEHKANLLDPSWREIGISSRHSSTAPGAYGNQPVTIITTDFGVRH
jgi:uncharacterized protein YkwD